MNTVDILNSILNIKSSTSAFLTDSPTEERDDFIPSILRSDDDAEGAIVRLLENLALEDEVGSAVKHSDNTQPLKLLHDSLVNHRWHEAASLLSILPQKGGSSFDVLLRVGIEIIYQEPEACGDLFEQLINQLKLLANVDSNWTILCAVLFLLKQKRFEDAAVYLKYHRKLRGKASKDVPKSSQGFKTLRIGYEGLVHWALWKISVQRKFENTINMNDVENSEHSINDRNFTEACNAFTCLYEHDGCWDVFVMKHLEMLEWYSREEEAELLLIARTKRDAFNFNTWKMLYNFYKRCNFPDCKLHSVAEKIANLSPADSIVLEWHRILTKQGKKPEVTLPLLFHLLDYAEWQHEIKPWKRLAKQLCQIFKSEQSSDLISVDECWATRATWWPFYHFIPYITSNSVQTIHCYKATVAALLMGSDNEYSQTVLSLASSIKQLTLLQDSFALTRKM